MLENVKKQLGLNRFSCFFYMYYVICNYGNLPHLFYLVFCELDTIFIISAIRTFLKSMSNFFSLASNSFNISPPPKLDNYSLFMYNFIFIIALNKNLTNKTFNKIISPFVNIYHFNVLQLCTNIKFLIRS